MRFVGKVAIVTGGGSGIGAASARALSAQGANVAVVDVDFAAAEKVVDSMENPAIAIRADVGNENEVSNYIAETVDAYGKVDFHHLNAGIVGSLTSLTQTSTEEFDRVVAVNLRGVFLGIRDAFRQFGAQRTGGAIVVTSSIAGLRGSHDLLPYQASKHGTLGLVKGAAMLGGPHQIRVNAVAPGLVPTSLFSDTSGETGAGSDMEQRSTTVPLRRVGSPEEIASVVAFLLSDEAAYVNGAVVPVDGGSAQVNTVRPSGGAGAWDTSTLTLMDLNP